VDPLTLRQASTATGGSAQHGGAASAQNDCLRVREHRGATNTMGNMGKGTGG